jgi:hypothetical protein
MDTNRIEIITVMPSVIMIAKREILTAVAAV